MRELSAIECPLIELNLTPEGLYPIPNMPCGILPCYVSVDGYITWGAVESNRVGVVVITPPTGTQDIVIIRDEYKYVLEFSKPLPDLELNFLRSYIGMNFSGTVYQSVLSLLKQNHYYLYLEHPLTTAFHETAEEHGTDIGINANKHNHLLMALLDFEPQMIQAKRGQVQQKIIIALLKNPEEIQLKHCDKIEEKIACNKGRVFYENGVWGGLVEFHEQLLREQEKFEKIKLVYSPPTAELMIAELAAFSSRLELMAKLERSVADYLLSIEEQVACEMNASALPYKLIMSSQENLGINRFRFNFNGPQTAAAADSLRHSEQQAP